MTREDLAVSEALELIGAVRRYDSQDVKHLLGVVDLPAVAVALAAMVDQDKTPQMFLAWAHAHYDGQDLDGWTWAEMHRAHAQYELHRSRGVEVPAEVRDGQRAYDRIRKRARTQLRLVGVAS